MEDTTVDSVEEDSAVVRADSVTDPIIIRITITTIIGHSSSAATGLITMAEAAASVDCSVCSLLPLLYYLW